MAGVEEGEYARFIVEEVELSGRGKGDMGGEAGRGALNGDVGVVAETVGDIKSD